MGIFSDNVRKYYEQGIYTIPCKDKRPILGKSWQEYCLTPPTDEIIDRWEKEYKSANQLGLLLGSGTKMAGFDFDAEFDEKKCSVSKSKFDKDKKIAEQQIISLLPPTPVIKTGRKGWTRIYNYHNNLENAQCDLHGIRLFDFLAHNKQTIIPPSYYNEGSDLSYKWLGSPIEDCVGDIPLITKTIIDDILLLVGNGREKYDFDNNGRHGKLLKWLIDVMKIEKDNDKVAHELIKLDLKNNPDNPYLSDKGRFPARNTPMQNAMDWVKRNRKYINISSQKETPPVGEDGWDYFFDNAFEITRKDIIAKEVFIKNEPKDEWRPIRDLEDVLRAYANISTFSVPL